MLLLLSWRKIIFGTKKKYREFQIQISLVANIHKAQFKALHKHYYIHKVHLRSQSGGCVCVVCVLYVHVHVGVYMCVDIHEETSGQCWVSFLISFYLIFVRLLTELSSCRLS